MSGPSNRKTHWRTGAYEGGGCMKKTMRSPLALLTLAAAVVCLAACGPQQPANASVPLAGSIQYLIHSGDRTGLAHAHAVAEEFHRMHPDAHVEIQNLSYDNYVSTVRSRIASGNAPDVFSVEGDFMRELSANGYLADVADVATPLGIAEDDLKAVTFDGVVAAVPSISAAVYCVMYNRACFDAAGLTEPPKTLDGFYEACRALERQGITPIAAGYKEFWPLMADMQTDYVGSVLCRAPDEIRSLVARESTFAGSELWRQSLARLCQRYRFVNSDAFETDWAEACRRVAMGEAAMVLSGRWAASSIQENNEAASLGAFPLPFSNDPNEAKIVMLRSVRGFSVSSHSDNPALAKAFLLFMLQQSRSSGTPDTPDIPKPSIWRDIDAYVESGRVTYLEGVEHNFPGEYRKAIENTVSKHLQSMPGQVDALLRDVDAEFDRLSSAAG